MKKTCLKAMLRVSLGSQSVSAGLAQSSDYEVYLDSAISAVCCVGNE